MEHIAEISSLTDPHFLRENKNSFIPDTDPPLSKIETINAYQNCLLDPHKK